MISLFTRDDSLPIFKQNYVKFFEKNMCLKSDLQLDSDKGTLRTIVIKNDNLFCYIVRNGCLKYLVFKLWFLDIL